MRRAVFLILLATSHVAVAAQGEVRLAVVVGSNEGLPEDEPLRFAESDAARFRDVLLQLGGVDSRALFFSRGQSAAHVRRQLQMVKALAESLPSARSTVTLLFYFSGHGDEEAVHLPGGKLPLPELRALLDAIPARLRISFLDSCRSSASTKGVRRGPEFMLTAPVGSPAGTVEMRAASSGEAALESSELAGALFTHYLASAMRGAADFDGDGQVTLAEAYAYAFRRTLMRSGASGAFQRPALGADLAGAGEVVLTRLARASSTLELPTAAGDHYLVFAVPSGAVMAEISSATERMVALPAGRFIVQRARGGRFAVTSVDLSFGGSQTLVDSDFEEVSRRATAARGPAQLRPWLIVVGAGGEWATAGQEANGTALRVSAAVSRAMGPVRLAAEVSYSGGPVETAGFTGTQWGVGLSPLVGAGWVWRHAQLAAVVGVDLRLSTQTLSRRDAVALPWLPASETRWYTSLGPRGGLQLGVPVGHHVSVELSTNLSVMMRRETSEWAGTQLRVRPFGSVQLGVGYRP